MGGEHRLHSSKTVGIYLFIAQVRRTITATATTVSTAATARCTIRASRPRVRTTPSVATCPTRRTHAAVEPGSTASTVSCTTRAPTRRAFTPACATPSTDASSATASRDTSGQLLQQVTIIAAKNVMILPSSICLLKVVV